MESQQRTEQSGDEQPETAMLHVFDVTRRDGVDGYLRVMLGESKEDAQGELPDWNMDSEFEKHAERVDDPDSDGPRRYRGGDIGEHDLIRTLDGDSVYDGVEYLGAWSEAIEEMKARLSTGAARDCTFSPPEARDRADEDEIKELLKARDEGREVSNA